MLPRSLFNGRFGLIWLGLLVAMTLGFFTIVGLLFISDSDGEVVESR